MEGTNRQIRLNFLAEVMNGITAMEYSFSCEPDFGSFKHGNLKFYDNRLVLRSTEFYVVVTLEHYAIKREGWHPIYWGLQCFYNDGTAMLPEAMPFFQALSNAMKREMDIVKPGVYDESLIESKYGWFGWVCFVFPGETSDLDNPEVNMVLRKNSGDIAKLLVLELCIFIECWRRITDSFRTSV